MIWSHTLKQDAGASRFGCVARIARLIYTTHPSGIESLLRSIDYRVEYSALSRVFYIGELNKKHYLKHRSSKFKTET